MCGTVGEVEVSRKEHDAADTHVQCQGALVVSVRCRCETRVHLRHWELCAREGVCAQLSCPSSLLCLFFADGVTACGGCTPRPGAAFRPGHSSSLRESVITRTQPQFAVQPRVSGRMGPERALFTIFLGKYADYGTLSFGSLWSPTHRAGLIHGVT